MACEVIKSGDVTIFSCRRGRGDVPKCTHCGRYAALGCEYPLSGAKAGSRCDRALCVRCSVDTEMGKCCPAHARMIAKKNRAKEDG